MTKCLQGWKFVLSEPLSRIVVTCGTRGGEWISQPFVQIITASIFRHLRPLIVLGNHPFAGAFLHNIQNFISPSHSSLLMGYSHPNIWGDPGRRNIFDQNYDGCSPPSLASKYPVCYHSCILRSTEWRSLSVASRNCATDEPLRDGAHIYGLPIEPQPPPKNKICSPYWRYGLFRASSFLFFDTFNSRALGS